VSYSHPSLERPCGGRFCGAMYLLRVPTMGRRRGGAFPNRAFIAK